MRHYEVVFLVHPDQSEQVPAMVDKYRTLIESGGGSVHRFEDWGRRHLAYNIGKVHKAHYVLMNVECDQPAIDEIASMFKFSDAVLRNLIIRRDEAITEPSLLAEAADDDDEDGDDDRTSGGMSNDTSEDSESDKEDAQPASEVDDKTTDDSEENRV
ncbi:MAG: 30S ribosomal protein S6 [Gammaproteobacteria bacterium]|nr:30S ribosomal protein S6 [Gammaproteobacteria bacterium]